MCTPISNFQMVMIIQLLGVPYKCVSFVLEDANLLNGTKMCECLLQQLLWKATGNAATVHGAIGRTRLVIHFIKRQRLWITWKAQNVIRQLGISFLSPVLVLFWGFACFFITRAVHWLHFFEINHNFHDMMATTF